MAGAELLVLVCEVDIVRFHFTAHALRLRADDHYGPVQVRMTQFLDQVPQHWAPAHRMQDLVEA